MKFAASVEELAKKRISVRDYEPRKLEDPLRQKIMDILSSRQGSIFDSSIRLELVSQGSGRKQKLAPSASNKQPWRIIRENKDKYNFFLKNSLMHIRTPDYLNLQYIDMGIALSHFELACREQVLPGKWVNSGTKKQDNGLDHIITWKASDRDQSPGAVLR